MAAVNPKDLSKYVGILYVAPVDDPLNFSRVASVRGLTSNLDLAANVVDIKADDTGTVIKGVKPEARIEGSFLENADRDIMKLILGGTDSNVSGAPVSITGEALGTGWTVGQPIKLANKNGANTEVASIVIDADGTPLVLNTDYAVYVGDGNNGDLGFTYITPITAQAGVLDADYDYTPNTSENLTVGVVFQEPPRLVVKIEAPDPTDVLKKRTTILTDATFEGIMAHEYLDLVEAGDLAGTTFNFKANDGAEWQYSNEIL